MMRARMAADVRVVLASIGAGVGIVLGGGAGATPIDFVDETVGCGVSFKHEPSAAFVPMPQANMIGGMAVGDFDNDGWPDIFWVSGGVGADRLFMNNGDGTFTDRASEWGVAQEHGGCGACAGDYNGDGWLDIYVTSFGTGMHGQGQLGKNRLYRNNGDGSFTDVAVEAGVQHTSYVFPSGFGCSFGDYDLDGDLDLCVAAWFGPSTGNRLYRNDGDGTFTDVTGVALTFPPNTWGFQSRFADIDNDGWPDLLFSADFSTSRLFHNNGDGTFTDITVASGTGHDQNGMGQCLADFTKDGLLDWYVTSIYLDVQQPNSGEGNKLYINQGDAAFVESAALCGVDDGGWGWGTVGIDFDHDTLPDIAEINGRPFNSEHSFEQIYLWRNNGDLTFTEMALDSGLVFLAEGRSLSYLDYDRDGRMDLAMTFNNEFNKLYRNTSDAANWIHVTFDTMANPLIAPNGLNSRVEAVVGGQTHIFEVDGGPNYLGTSEICAHLGLGDAETIDTLRVRWARGYVTELHDVPANQHLTIAAPRVCDFVGSGDQVNSDDLGFLLSSWGSVGTSSDRRADVTNDGEVDSEDLGLLLSQFGT
ncbi:MAG: CRTAC1 family protein [Phycisphaerales bacterium]